MTERIELSLRGLPEWLIREYLVELGATAADEAGGTSSMAGDGWTVSWTQQRAAIAGSSLALTQFDLVFEGADLQGVHDEFMKKAQRGGG